MSTDKTAASPLACESIPPLLLSTGADSAVRITRLTAIPDRSEHWLENLYQTHLQLHSSLQGRLNDGARKYLAARYKEGSVRPLFGCLAGCMAQTLLRLGIRRRAWKRALFYGMPRMHQATKSVMGIGLRPALSAAPVSTFSFEERIGFARICVIIQGQCEFVCWFCFPVTRCLFVDCALVPVGAVLCCWWKGDSTVLIAGRDGNTRWNVAVLPLSKIFNLNCSHKYPAS